MRRALVLVGPVAITLAVIGGSEALLAVLLVIAGAGTWEFLRLARARGVVPAEPVALFGTAGILVLAYIGDERAPRLYPAVLAAFFVLAFGEVLIRRDRNDVTKTVALTVLPVFTVGVFASFLLTLRGMPDGLRLALVLVAMVGAAELMQGAVARATPNALARVLASEAGVFAVAVVVGVLDDRMFSKPVLITLAALVGVAVPIGRLAAHMIDRDLRGTSGLAARLVRIDGLLLAAPVFFYVFRALAR